MSSDLPYEAFDVAVDGGALRVGRWGPPPGSGAPVLLCLHGITANHRSFLALAEQLGDRVTVLAPDLRGRGGSAAVEGPSSMAVHADDMVRLLDEVGVEEAGVLGHSMGGFVAVVLANRHSGRVDRLVLVDGGVPLDLPEALLQLPVEDLTRAIIGPALDRLSLTFASVEEYFDRWREHPAFVDQWSRHAEDYFRYDLVGEEPELRSGVRAEPVLQDAESQLVTDDVVRAVDGLAHPTLWIRAPHGLTGEAPLYDEAYAERWASERAGLVTLTTVPGVNHYTVLVSETGARTVAQLVESFLA